ncbi:uncharacterized protein V6R79_005087 [Siganus canaliculatus]
MTAAQVASAPGELLWIWTGVQHTDGPWASSEASPPLPPAASLSSSSAQQNQQDQQDQQNQHHGGIDGVLLLEQPSPSAAE